MSQKSWVRGLGAILCVYKSPPRGSFTWVFLSQVLFLTLYNREKKHQNYGSQFEVDNGQQCVFSR